MAKTVKSPRISVNKLAEYLEADSTRRRQIVYDAKYPKDFKGIRYKEVKEAVVPYLIDRSDKKMLEDAITRFTKKKPTTTWQQQDKELSIEILKSLLNIDLTALKNCILKGFKEENKLLMIKGVAISIYPDLIVTKTIKGILNKGAIKLHSSKSFPLKEDGQKNVAGLLHHYVSNHMLKAGEIANPKLSVSLDLFTGELFYAPTAFKSKMTKIEAACEEIALRWSTL